MGIDNYEYKYINIDFKEKVIKIINDFDYEDFDVWLKSLSNKELILWYDKTNKFLQNKDSIQEYKEMFEICSSCYCKELEIDEIPLDSELLYKLFGQLVVGIQLEIMYRKKEVNIDGKIYFYKSTKVYSLVKEDENIF